MIPTPAEPATVYVPGLFILGVVVLFVVIMAAVKVMRRK
jgi:hypothetical protein